MVSYVGASPHLYQESKALVVLNDLYIFHFTCSVVEIINSFIPSHLLLVGSAYVVGLVPSFVSLRLLLRREYYTPSTTVYSTSAARLWGLATPALTFFVAVYAIQGWVLAFAYAVNAGVREWEDPRLSIFAPSA